MSAPRGGVGFDSRSRASSTRSSFFSSVAVRSSRSAGLRVSATIRLCSTPFSTVTTSCGIRESADPGPGLAADCASTTAPETTAVMVPTATARPLSFATSMVLRTPSESEAAEAEKPAAAMGPAATSVAASTVDSNRWSGTIADLASRTTRAESAATGSETPREARRSRSRALARASRLESVPSGMPSRRAASGRGTPSSSQRTTGPRCRAGRRASSSSRISRSSSGKSSSGGSTWIGALTRSSLALRRAARVRASFAVRTATPYSQLATFSRRTTEAAFRARTRNVAWKASSASCASPRMRRQTPSTIGPCLCTSSANASSAASSRRARNLSSNCSSPSEPATPNWKRVRKCLTTSGDDPPHMTILPGPQSFRAPVIVAAAAAARPSSRQDS